MTAAMKVLFVLQMQMDFYKLITAYRSAREYTIVIRSTQTIECIKPKRILCVIFSTGP